MDRSQIIALEEEVMALTRRLNAFTSNKDIASDDRNYAGTLWLNLNTLRRESERAAHLLNNRFCFEAEAGWHGLR